MTWVTWVLKDAVSSHDNHRKEGAALIHSVVDAHGDAPRVVYGLNYLAKQQNVFKDTSLEREVAAPLMWRQA